VQGAYLLGEETILLKALEGKRGQPEQRPPYPTTRGLRGLPTVVHNVQTLAAIPWIIVNGAEAFAKIGPAECPGTILVQVRGPGGSGIAEIPMGTRLRDVVALAGSMPAGRSLKAVLVGGPSGGILPPDALDIPYTFSALRAAGAHVGSGSVIVADDRACIVDLARVLTRFCADEACGKTIPCRIGTRRLSEIGDRLAAGTSRAGDLDLITDLASGHRGLRTVRPRAPDDAPARERDAILPSGARRASRTRLLPRGRVPSDRDGSERDAPRPRSWLT